jgi:hypothetical protein
MGYQIQMTLSESAEPYDVMSFGVRARKKVFIPLKGFGIS